MAAVELPDDRESLAPAPEAHMSALMDSVSQADLDALDESKQFQKITESELREILDWISVNGQFQQFVCVGKGTSDAPLTVKDVTLSPSGLPHGSPRNLEDSWVMVDENDLLASQFLRDNKNAVELQRPPGFFQHWPSFGVYDKLSYVLSYTGSAFFWGYIIGGKAALDALYRLVQHPGLAFGVGAASSFAAALAPQVMLKALQYVVIGGLVGGAAVATPVFVVGSTGVFVAASIYHTFQATKRIPRAVRGPNVDQHFLEDKKPA